MIAELAITCWNYKEEVTICEFGNTQLIINKQMEHLLNLAPVSSSQDLRSLRMFYNSLEGHVHGLKALGVASESYGSLLSSVLLNKILQDICMIVSREVKRETGN